MTIIYLVSLSLVNAFQDIDKLLFISGNDIVNRLTQHRNVVDAAKQAGVKHIIYTSYERKNETESSPLFKSVGESHLKTEEYLKMSGINYTILKNNLYLDLIPFFIGEDVIETGSIYFPAQSGNAAFALRSEMAEVAANIIISTSHENKIYDLSNAEAYNFDDVAKSLSDITGKNIVYTSPSPQEYQQILSNIGIPQEFIELFSTFAKAQAQGELDITSKDLERLLGTRPTALQEYLKSVYTIK
ncbi:hypothetical protein B0A69_02815 [Chryseobacterium shigense]|uniref:NAD(P)H dehydrogenase (Quinone) n=1 Tax=Chryseobacterium shigense TaxID=297244 RepID=A0A1N7I8A0_9FLAO|nr:SDR family oxidoreductase [Chryseobacterium shigense]PQA96996.1 hypothetical protein B0A69_02815 [Chryseobacterium shigense]SIS33263.1 NAD(P)H dehydrogenase (quinone) [Chryseobacterium shigense]